MIVSGMCNVAKVDFMRGVHQPGDEYKIALYGKDANLSPMTETYTPDGEVKAKGYHPGGMTLQGYRCDLDGTTAVMGWEYDPVWKNVTITAYGALIYNASKGNRALAVVEFPSPVTSTNGNFRIKMPAVNATEAPLWIG